MPTQTQVQNTILSGQLQLANLVLANTNKEAGGCNNVDWFPAWRYYLNIKAVQRQFNLADYSSDYFLAVYSCLVNQIGFDPAVNFIDPNYQPPSGTIVVTNPNSYLSPVVLTFDSFDPASQLPDGGRTTYRNSNWVGINPFMALTSPGLTGLEFGSDYTLLSSGGFVLSSSGNLPEIYEGQLITIYSYAIA